MECGAGAIEWLIIKHKTASETQWARQHKWTVEVSCLDTLPGLKEQRSNWQFKGMSGSGEVRAGQQ